MDEFGRIERRLSLHDLRVLMVVVQAGSMGKAAKLLATSQPAVSRSIGELEQALGVRLLDRSAQGIEPTSFGRALLKRSAAVSTSCCMASRIFASFPIRPLAT